MYEVHVSGHACQDELKMMLALTKPKFFIPIHGEYKHMKKHEGLAIKMGIPEKNIFLLNIGQVVETDSVEMKVVGQVPAGKVLVDGLGVGDVGSVVLRDRKHLSEDGLIVVVTTINRETGMVAAGPDIVSRGFVYVRESEELMDEAKQLVKKTLQTCADRNIREWGNIQRRLNIMEPEVDGICFTCLPMLRERLEFIVSGKNLRKRIVCLEWLPRWLKQVLISSMWR